MTLLALLGACDAADPEPIGLPFPGDLTHEGAVIGDDGEVFRWDWRHPTGVWLMLGGFILFCLGGCVYIVKWGPREEFLPGERPAVRLALVVVAARCRSLAFVPSAGMSRPGRSET